jgi:hypothetical protein
LSVDGKQYPQKLDVVLDPRVRASASDLAEQWNLARSSSAAMEASFNAYNEYAALQSAITLRQTSLKDNPQAKDLLEALAKLEKNATSAGEGSTKAPGIGPMNRDISRYFVMVESADMKPAASAQRVTHDACVALRKNLDTWQQINAETIPALNKQLETFHLADLPVATRKQPLACE